MTKITHFCSKNTFLLYFYSLIKLILVIFFSGMRWPKQHWHFVTSFMYEFRSGWRNLSHNSRRFLWFGFSFKKRNTKFPSAIAQTMAAARNRTHKLSMPSWRKDTDECGSGLVNGSGQLSSIFLNHAFLSWVTLLDSCTCRMALETSATRGDPMGKTCKINLWS